MARSYYRRRWYGRRTFRKKNWSSNIITSQTTITFPASANYGGGSAICLNPIQSVSTVSQPFTVKNIKLSVSCVASETAITNALDNIIVAIVYVPQGYAVTYNTLSEHPEWFMAIKYLDNPTIEQQTSGGSQYKPFTVSTRLARKLQTGDSVQLCVFGTNTEATTSAVTVRFMAQWWTCAN
uniref:Capsid protein n=1 Tax=Entamoeba-associated CRESS DNA virus 4 TaxID=2766564 RepID=A0A7G8KWJ1_9VIRU|nr:capsid protein [Entamoeba-associated CRESS DNA virus 4]